MKFMVWSKKTFRSPGYLVLHLILVHRLYLVIIHLCIDWRKSFGDGSSCYILWYLNKAEFWILKSNRDLISNRKSLEICYSLPFRDVSNRTTFLSQNSIDLETYGLHNNWTFWTKKWPQRTFSYLALGRGLAEVRV